MTKQSVGILGCGSIGHALALGLNSFAKDLVSLQVCVKHDYQAQNMQDIGIQSTFLAHEICANDICIIAVRSEQVLPLLRELAPSFEKKSPKLVISVAAEVSLAELQEVLSPNIHFACMMPNVPVSVGQGIVGLCYEQSLPKEKIKNIHQIFGRIGTVVYFEQALMNAFNALAGCGPALHFYLMDSFIEAGVGVGLSRDQASIIAKSLMRSCGSYAESTQTHPAILRELATAPAGMANEGLHHFSRKGVRGHVIDAIRRCFVRGNDINAKKELNLD